LHTEIKIGSKAADENHGAVSEKTRLKGTGRLVAPENFNLNGLNSPQLAA
jgi:hypothetical protein